MRQLRDHEGRSIDLTSPSAGRKAYATPHLLEYGSIAKLTQGNNGSVADAGSMPTQMKARPRDNPGDAPGKRRDR